MADQNETNKGLVRKAGFKTAWLEYQDPRDAVAHIRGFHSHLGFDNLFFPGLPFKGTSKITLTSSNLSKFEVRKEKFLSKLKAFIGIPHDDDLSFLQRWVCNPGIESNKLNNTTLSEVSDILSVSGHGTIGWVFGDRFSSGDQQQIHLPTAYNKRGGTHLTGRLKLLMIPACTNVAFENSVRWENALIGPNPIHIILGYHDSYSGDHLGGLVQKKFAEILSKDIDKPIIEAWREANMAVSRPQPWAAITTDLFRNESILDWASIGPPSPGTAPLIHFDEKNPGGRTVPVSFDFNVQFINDTSTVITHLNSATGANLNAGKSGKLRITANSTPFKSGDVLHVLFYLFRPTKLKMDLDKFLIFDPSHFSSGLISKVVDGNSRKSSSPTGKPDGIKINVSTTTSQIELDFTVFGTPVPFWLGSNGLLQGPNGSVGVFVPGFFGPGVPLTDTKKELVFYGNSALYMP